MKINVKRINRRLLVGLIFMLQGLLFTGCTKLRNIGDENATSANDDSPISASDPDADCIEASEIPDDSAAEAGRIENSEATSDDNVNVNKPIYSNGYRLNSECEYCTRDAGSDVAGEYHDSSEDGTISSQDYLKASYPDNLMFFGSSVFVQDRTLAVSAFMEGHRGNSVDGYPSNNAAYLYGVVCLFTYEESVWHQEAYLTASNTDVDNGFGISVSLYGDTLAVGSPNEAGDVNTIEESPTNNTATGSGAVYVFIRDGTAWRRQAYLKASDTNVYNNFGHSVALYGDTLVVGASSKKNNVDIVDDGGNDDVISNSGAIFVYFREGTAWRQQALLRPDSIGLGSSFESRVAIFGDTLAVGTPNDSSGATGINNEQKYDDAPNSGAAFVFIRKGTNWSQQAYLKASNPDLGDHFGSSISIYNDTLAVGAPYESSNAKGIDGDQENNDAANSGAVYLFTRDGTQWSQEGYLKASNTNSMDAFGISVSLNDDTLAVGANGESSGSVGINSDQYNHDAPGSGAVYLFSRDGTQWHQQSYVKASDTELNDRFGLGVSLSADLLAVGAPYKFSNSKGIDGSQDNNEAQISGAVYVFH